MCTDCNATHSSGSGELCRQYEKVKKVGGVVEEVQDLIEFTAPLKLFLASREQSQVRQDLKLMMDHNEIEVST